MNASSTEVLKAPHIQDTAGLSQWLLVGSCVGGAVFFTLIIIIILYLRRRSRKKRELRQSWTNFCSKDMVSGSSVSRYLGNYYRRPLGPSASDPPLLHNTIPKLVQPRPSLPRWYTFPGPQTTSSDVRDYDDDLPPCLHGRLWFSLSYKDQKLEVTVRKAKYLPGRDVLNLPRDPFIKVFLLPDETVFHQTKVRKRTLNPVFNETFTFDLRPSELHKRTLKFSMYDVDKRKVRHCLGHALQSLDLLMSMERVQFYKDLEIAPQAVAPPGAVQLSLTCNPFSDRIKVTICRIRLLNYHSAIFVRVELYHGNRMVKMKKTQTIKCQGYGEQVVDESFGFAVSGRLLDSCSLVVTVVLEEGVPLGKVVVGPFMYARGGPLQHWQDMLSNPRTSVSRWHPLTDCNDDKQSSFEKQ